jgi:hypothetical protein
MRCPYRVRMRASTIRKRIDGEESVEMTFMGLDWNWMFISADTLGGVMDGFDVNALLASWMFWLD